MICEKKESAVLQHKAYTVRSLQSLIEISKKIYTVIYLFHKYNNRYPKVISLLFVDTVNSNIIQMTSLIVQIENLKMYFFETNNIVKLYYM